MVLSHYSGKRRCGNSLLKHRFSRIYRIAIEKEARVSDLVQRLNSELTFSWNWSRTLTGRLVSEVRKLEEDIAGTVFKSEGSDSWVWRLSTGGRWSTKLLSSLILHHSRNQNNSLPETQRNSLVPSKVALFIWRASKGRIPCRVELDKRGLDLDSVRCPICDDNIETVEHSLISCKRAREIWEFIYKWWQFGSPDNLNLDAAFKGNGFAFKSNFGKTLWQAVEWVTGYTIWKHRNESVFNRNKMCSAVIVSEIQVLSHLWISNRVKGFEIEWLRWLLNPLSFDTLCASRTGIG
ncbi:uncharacterized protein [Rutidosis leptorrhynchoides]|uniref:uncharacterized protein n=1 Tax=Rutidosis leptorrhynchoides TaxID=125765 RepID=UPI003A9A52F6